MRKLIPKDNMDLFLIDEVNEEPLSSLRILSANLV